MNKPVVSFSRFAAALFVVAALTVSTFADYVPFVKVDVNGYNNGDNKAKSGTLTGYNGLNFANETLTNTVTISPDISVKVDRVSTTKNRDRQSSKGDAVTNDFIFEQTVNEPITVTLNGLTVGKEYSLKIYSQDITANNGTSGTWNITQGETTTQIGVQPNTTGNASYKVTDPATYLAYTFTAEANSAVLTGLATGSFVFLNGIELNEAYDAASGYTRFDVNSNQKDGSESRIMSPRSTELFVDNTNTSNTATATAPSGITMTVMSDNVLNSRTRNKTNSSADMNMFNDFVFSGSKVPFTTTLENLSADSIYRMTVYSLDPSQDQSAGIWTMTNANGEELFKTVHNPTFSNAATWSFTQTFNPGTTSVSMLAELNGKAFTMLNGLELQEINANTSDYTWAAGRAQWLADGKWVDKQGVAGVPAAGDVCYITSPDPTGMNTSYWLETTTTEFPATLVMASGSRMIFKSNATVNDMILDNGYLHHGEGDKTFSLSGKLCVTSDSTIDIDDGSKRTLQIKSTLSGSGNLAINGNGSGNAIVEISNANANGYSGQFLLNKATLKLSGTDSTLGTGALNIPSDSKLSMAGTRRGLLKVPALTGNGPISVDDTSFLALATSDPQTYNGTISVAKDKAIHVGYNDGSDHAANVSLPNATVSLVSNATLGLVHENNSAKVSSFEIGTLNGVAGSIVRASGSINTGSANFATLTVGQGDFAGVMGGSNSSQVKMALVKNTDGTLTLSGANVYTGGTTIEAGKIVLSGAGTLGAGKTTIGENGTLEYNVADGAEKTVGITAANAITGTGSVLKTGAGVLKINNENDPGTFTADAFSVEAGELDFKGDFAGDMIIGAQGVLSPGNSTGTLSVTGNVTVDGAALFEFDSFDDGTFDKLFVLGADNAFTAADGTIELSFLNNDAEAWAAPDSAYQLVANDGFQTGDFTSWLTDDFGGLFGLEGRADGLYLVAAASPEPGSGVPEPSTWALLALGAAGLLYWRKRK
ncbi:MAG: PEP-CTERM sorting domain-containing protein [Thermoguttaceae bacterium]|nr:PEP-CTERM sorting domain-containing protein [Thermoguttaceae bacterium]